MVCMRKMCRKLLYCFILAVLLVFKSGEIVALEKYKVVDGDSLEQGRKRIRLIDIDAPELFQECYDENNEVYDCGKVATYFLKKIVAGGVVCKNISVDMYKRSLMDCFDKNGENINQKMVLGGWAVSYSDRFIDEEKIAKNKKIGIWKGRFIRPELYRSLYRKQKNSNKFEKR